MRGGRAEGVNAADDAAARRDTWLAAVVVALLATLPYLPALRAEFLTYHDDAYVSANRFVLQGL